MDSICIHMTGKIKQGILTPFYVYLALLVSFYSLRWLNILEVNSWVNYFFIFLVFIAPLLVLLGSIIIYTKTVKLIKWHTVFLLGAAPGFFPGAIFGFGLWSFGHGDTFFGFLSSILFTGLPTAFAFGFLGLSFGFLFKKVRKNLLN